MALEITKTAEATLTIQGTSIALESVYSRIELASGQNGVNMQMGMYPYEDKASFTAGSKTVKIIELSGLYNGEADIDEGETQSIQLASEQVKAKLEEQGYIVAIVDL